MTKKILSRKFHTLTIKSDNRAYFKIIILIQNRIDISTYSKDYLCNQHKTHFHLTPKSVRFVIKKPILIKSEKKILQLQFYFFHSIFFNKKFMYLAPAINSIFFTKWDNEFNAIWRKDSATRQRIKFALSSIQ